MDLTESGAKELGSELEKKMSHTCRSKKLFTSNKLQPDDEAALLGVGGEVWALTRVKCSILLCPVESGYHLVGEAYVHSNMRGEAVKDA